MEQETFPATDLFYQGLGNSIAIRKFATSENNYGDKK